MQRKKIYGTLNCVETVENHTENASALLPLNAALDALEDAYGFAPSPDAIYDAFASWAQSTSRPLYPHQEEALLATLDFNHMIVSTPTGSGKSMVALAAIFNALAHGKTAYYTAPLKALVSEKFFDLVALFGAENVGMSTGDTSINPHAPIVCATAEIVANMALKEGEGADIDTLIHDEFHFYADRERGWAWQVPLLELTRTQHVLLSATLGNTDFFKEDLEKRTGVPCITIADAPRPVPLSFEYSMTALPEKAQELINTGKTPIYIVHFSQREAVTQAQNLLSHVHISKEKKEAIKQATKGFRFAPGFGKLLSKLVASGIGVHHAGLLPRYRRLIERLAQEGLLAIICGTDTLGVGINVPIHTVMFTALSKFDGRRERHIHAREFHQIAGRAGRAGFDTEGEVIAQAPEIDIEFAQAKAKAADNPKKLKKVTRRQPPAGAVMWSEATFTKLIESEPEKLTSHMVITHTMLLNILAGDYLPKDRRPKLNAFERTVKLLTDNHEPESSSNMLVRQALDIYFSLRQAGVVVYHDRDWQEAHPGASPVEFGEHVPDDFALYSPLSPFALAACEALDPDSPDYALDVLSVIEAIEENPMPVLVAQEKAEKAAAIARMKNAGMSYEERMARIEDITWPEPLKELLAHTFAIYKKANPWVARHELTPKSIVRMMIEQQMTFTQFVSRFDCARSEGVLLRYLTNIYKAMRLSLPTYARTQEVEEITDWIGQLVRSVDSSLLDEWEALAANQRDGLAGSTHSSATPADTSSQMQESTELAFGQKPGSELPVSQSPFAFRASIAKSVFRLIEAIEFEDADFFDSIADRLEASPDGHAGEYFQLLPDLPSWDYDAIEDAMADYFDLYEHIRIDADARSRANLTIIPFPQAEDFAAAGIDSEHALKLAEMAADQKERKEGRYDRSARSRVWLGAQRLLDDEGDNGWALIFAVDIPASDKAGKPVIALVTIAENAGYFFNDR